MEIREFAERILRSDSLAVKLEPVTEEFTDDHPGDPLHLDWPARPPELQFCLDRRAHRMPKAIGFYQPHCRAVAHHIMANHELQALEVMALVMCAFPDAPADFRRGMIKIMHDEQRHTQLHIDRLEALGMRFGELRVNAYFWKKAGAIENLLEYLACLPLTFEGGNLDHCLEFARRFSSNGDEKGAAVMQQIRTDEIEHLAFGVQWLRRVKSPEITDWDCYVTNLHWPLKPANSRGPIFDRAGRIAAGLDPDFIRKLEELPPRG